MKSFTTNGDFYRRIPTRRFKICWHIIKMLVQSIVSSIQTSNASLKSIKSIKNAHKRGIKVGWHATNCYQLFFL
jgi:hypothetical protein